ncbi:MAG: hypothetical protein QOC82_1571 [Frankiaceae bacterium]|jgi:hypothetical protein|nr:hypothetical protein [Frankiaceae bacterium]
MSLVMRRHLSSLALAVAVLGGGTAVAASPSGGDAAQACYDNVPGAATLNSPQRVPCRVGQQADRQAGAACRTVVTDGSCQPIDGRAISPAQIAAYQRSWVHRALSLQRQLGERAPVIDTQIVHTHNSFNASAYALNGTQPPSYYATLTNQDPNQVYSITDQLNMDVRFIEMDLHWVPSPYGTAATNGYWVTLCHGDGQQAPATGTWVHVGCTADRPAQDGFAELKRWLVAHPSEFVFVYLENQLYDGSPVASAKLGHDTAASLIQQQLGSLVYRPQGTSDGHCADAPWSTSVAAMRAHGARMVLVGNCGPGTAWPSWVFTRGSKWDESGTPNAYSASDCARDRAGSAGDSRFRRFFEDSTVLAAARQSTTQITDSTAAMMVRCGVNIIGMDQLTTDDPRLAALVWSWAPGQPASGGCATATIGGRFVSADCGAAHRYACRDSAGGWHATVATGPWRNGPDACAAEFPGSRFAVPTNGYDDTLLPIASVSGAPTWLAYAQVGGQWRNLEGLLPLRSSGDGDGDGHGKGRGKGKGKGHGHALAR